MRSFGSAVVSAEFDPLRQPFGLPPEEVSLPPAMIISEDSLRSATLPMGEPRGAQRPSLRSFVHNGAGSA